jgi:hypothetical protein
MLYNTNGLILVCGMEVVIAAFTAKISEVFCGKMVRLHAASPKDL